MIALTELVKALVQGKLRVNVVDDGAPHEPAAVLTREDAREILKKAGVEIEIVDGW